MDVLIKKVSERDGRERFVLLNVKTGQPVTAHDASEASIRRYFRGKGLATNFLDDCFRLARDRFLVAATVGSVAAVPGGQTGKPTASAPSDPSSAASQPAAVEDDDDLLFELGLADE